MTKLSFVLVFTKDAELQFLLDKKNFWIDGEYKTASNSMIILDAIRKDNIFMVKTSISLTEKDRNICIP